MKYVQDLTGVRRCATTSWPLQDKKQDSGSSQVGEPAGPASAQAVQSICHGKPGALTGPYQLRV
jgi:hypothetical protein